MYIVNITGSHLHRVQKILPRLEYHWLIGLRLYVTSINHSFIYVYVGKLLGVMNTVVSKKTAVLVISNSPHNFLGCIAIHNLEFYDGWFCLVRSKKL